jgi:hypothetical protein
MRLLLTSAGISNTSIHDALLDLQGKPIAEASTLFVSTAIYAMSVRDLLTCFRTKSSREYGRHYTRAFFAGVSPKCRCRAFNPQGLSGIELDQEKAPCIASDYDERLWVRHGSSGLHESDAGPEFGLRHLSFGFTFWRHLVPQPSS